ncbi:hypothetical protein [Actinacidiphila glaucinigra]|uniref:Lipoprotein n=1 Tax=Actinacidiphila glaucinigra TaxID=235986 RepID=A0A239JGW5_9ACTN|nr:hypothetical protein [Actinacidiphila glaucinigra]SNT05039.1 hypothetical protein SAMN05216252_11328 [Actinacidiphila glaucinigra]
MQSSRTGTGRAAAVAVALAVGAVVVTGCGGGAGASAPPSPSVTVPFGQKAVVQEMRAAVAAAGLREDEVEAGFGKPPGRLADADTERERAVAALGNRLASCAVVWSTTDAQEPHGSAGTGAPAGMRRQLDVVLSALAARGWKETVPSRETPIGDKGTYFVASYKKEGWFLHAGHTDTSWFDLVKVVATEEACLDRLTDEERALFED